MRFKKLVINITDLCTTECTVCMYGCSPVRCYTIDKDIVKDILNQTQRLKMIKTVVLSGGEAFTDLLLLKELIAYASDRQFSVLCGTNAFWCNDYNDTYCVLTELKDAGLTELMVSMDLYHQRAVPLSNIRNVLEALKNLRLKSQLNLVIDKMSSEASFSMLSQIADVAIDSDIHFLSTLPHKERGPAFPRKCCFVNKTKEQLKCSLTDGLLIHYTGEVYACPHHVLAGNGRLSLGSIYDHPIDELIRRAEEHPYTNFVLANGLSAVVDLLDEENYPFREKYVDGCDLCIDLMANDDQFCAIQEKIFEKDVRLRRFVKIQQQMR